MSLMEQIDQLEKRIKDLEDTVGITKLGLDDPDCPASKMTVEDDEDFKAYMIGAYHILSKKKNCVRFNTGDVWSDDPEDAQIYMKIGEAEAALKDLPKLPKNFHPLVLPAC